ncbi:MAG: CBS domain-containing protein [Pyrinomonadaceae bacterium]|nr:CBS domain-containing protein [Phycisphaerales bacterium]
MCIVADILRTKGDNVIAIGPAATVLEAARTMNVHHIGALVVTETGVHTRAALESDGPKSFSEADHGVLGIITERDIMTRVVAAEREPRDVRVGQVMTSPVVTCSTQTPLDEVRTFMRQRRIRHMPVISAHGLCGMISIGDLNTAHAQVMEETIRYLETYMYHG